MVSTVISTVFASGAAIGAAVVVCIVFWIAIELTDDKQRPALALFSHRLTAFAVPLLILFGYITIVWAADIISA